MNRESVVNFNRVAESDLTFLKDLVGAERVSTGQSELDLHSVDETYHRGYLPEVVVWPKTTEEVSRILKRANEKTIPVTPWGAGSSLEGNPLPVYGGMVLDFQQMDRILAVRADAFQADVQPGIKYQDMNKVLSRDGLFYAPDPGANATIGGMVANNASGIRTVKYGGTKDNVLKLEVVLPTGEVIRTGTHAHKSSSAYHLLHLFIGSEGTLGIVTEATLRLFGIPEKFSAAIVNFESVEDASKTVYEVMGSGLGPAALELLDQETIRVINQEGKFALKEAPTLFLEFTGASDISLKEDLNRAREICEGNQATDFQPGVGREERNRLWEARHQAYEFIKRHNPGFSFMIIDTAVPISRYSAMIRFAKETIERHEIKGYLFGHAGDGNLHVVVAGNFEDPDFIERRDRANEEIVFHALSLGGTATGEHGVGIGKRKFMTQEHGASLGVMKRMKHLFDPKGILNPGKIFP
jgi:D-lactate dehydrogenase (cytochrome)